MEKPVSESTKVRRLETTLKRFDYAYKQLAAAIDDIDGDVNILIATDYPFKQSFDELSVNQWVETSVFFAQRERQKLNDAAKEARMRG